MKLSAALNCEKMREDPASWNKIYLNHDGKFFHIYEWSAWLVKTIACTEEMQKQRGDQKMLSAMRYPTKDSEYVIIGFPIDSIGKYIPQYVSMTPVADGGGDVIIEVTLPDNIKAMTYDDIRKEFEQWREGCPVKEQKPRQDKTVPSNAQMATQRGGLFTIMTQVLSWPVESKTPLENAEFISSLKQQLIALL